MAGRRPSAPFLTAEWRHLAMLNWVVEPDLVAPAAPPGTELDLWEGRAYVSLVGFLFLRTRVRGVPVPLHRDFEEVNLRSYVRRRGPEGWRRGVFFVREVVPRALVALVARCLYGEPYVALPMDHEVRLRDPLDRSRGVRAVAYGFGAGPERRVLRVETMDADPVPLAPGSEEEFLAEHYWGYSPGRRGRALEYRVEHPPWRVQPARTACVEGPLARLYGVPLAEAIARSCDSAFVADGSPVEVRAGVRLAP